MSGEPLEQVIARVTRSDHDASWIDFGIDPHAAERIGEALGGLARDRGADLVVSWDGEEDVVLAHATAQALGTPRIVVHEDLGLLSLSRPIEGGCAVLVATRFSRYRSIDAVRRMLAARSIRLALAVELLASDDGTAAEPLVVSLAGGN